MRFGEPKDIPGECNAHLYIADNHGDNHATMRCQLHKGHKSDHREAFDRGFVVWVKDERDYEEMPLEV